MKSARTSRPPSTKPYIPPEHEESDEGVGGTAHGRRDVQVPPAEARPEHDGRHEGLGVEVWQIVNFDETVFRMLRKNRLKPDFRVQITHFPPKILLKTGFYPDFRFH